MPAAADDLDPVLDHLRTAISERRQIAFRYHDRHRVALPLRLGRDRDGQWFVRAVQVAGDSATGRLGTETPKLFRVERVEELTVRDRRFAVPRDYEQVDGVILDIDVELTRRADQDG